MPDFQDNTWAAWANKVLGDIERIEGKQDEMTAKINHLCVEIEILKTKASMAGAAWGTIMAIVVSLFLDFVLKGVVR